MSSSIPLNGSRYRGMLWVAGLVLGVSLLTRIGLLWYEGDDDFVRIDWKHGWVFAPPDMMYHQHYNTASHPSRYLAVALGSLRYPFTSEKRNLFAGVDVSVRDGGRQIEYGDQDPRIHRMYLEELDRNGVESRMGDHIDEAAVRAAMG